jgi:hypothetical protein
VPPDYDPRSGNVSPQVLEEAERLSHELLKETYPRYEPSQETIEKLENAFIEQCEWVESLFFLSEAEMSRIRRALEGAQH